MRLVAAVALLALATPALAQQTAENVPPFVPNEEHLEHIAAAGRLAGQIQSCELDWQPYYLEYMQSERRRVSNDGFDRDSEAYGQRIAFIGMFFGANQGQVLNQSEEEDCSETRARELAERAAAIIHDAHDREGETVERP